VKVLSGAWEKHMQNEGEKGKKKIVFSCKIMGPKNKVSDYSRLKHKPYKAMKKWPHILV
jgi:hypothetical protein